MNELYLALFINADMSILTMAESDTDSGLTHKDPGEVPAMDVTSEQAVVVVCLCFKPWEGSGAVLA